MPFYHTVSDIQLPHLTNIIKYKNTHHFETDLIFFHKYYKSVSLNSLIGHMKNKIPQKAFHLTFDDGLKENYNIIAPLLEERKMNATFFIATDFLDNKNLFYRHKASILIDYINKNDDKKIINSVVEILKTHKYSTNDLHKSILSINYEKKFILDFIANEIGISFREYLEINKPYLTSNQVKELLNAGFSIGSHSRDHPYFQKLKLSEQLDQVNTSLNFLIDRFSINYKAFAIPFNDFGLRKDFVDKLFSEVGINIYFGTAGMKRNEFSNNYQRFHLENRYANLFPMQVIKNKYSTTIFAELKRKYTLHRH